MGTLTAVDGDVLGIYWVAWATAADCIADITKNGTEYTVGTNGSMANRPAVARPEDAIKTMKSYGAGLGLGAARRTPPMRPLGHRLS